MNSSTKHHEASAPAAVSHGSVGLHGAVLRIKRADTFAMLIGPDEVEITLNAHAVAEIRSYLKIPPRRVRDYHTVAEEAARLKISEKTLRMLLKERRAPHYVVGSDIRIDPEAMDAWIEANYSNKKKP